MNGAYSENISNNVALYPPYFNNISYKDNPQNNGDIETFQFSLPLLAKSPVFSIVANKHYQADYSNFTTTTLSQDNLDFDTSAQTIMRNQITPPKSVVASNSTFGFWWTTFKDSLLNSTAYSIPWYNIVAQPSLSLSSTCNYACRVHVFEGLQYSTPVICIVDCITGAEVFRIINESSSTDESTNTNSASNNPTYLRNVKRVTNGVVDLATELTFKEMLQINTCIITEVADYAPWTTFLKTLSPPDLIKYASGGNPGVNTFMTATASTPFIDGMNGNIELSQIRLFAIDKPENTTSYLLSIPILPWNNGAYDMFDNQLGQWVSYSPFTSQNFTTLIKLVLLVLTGYELLEVVTEKNLVNRLLKKL